MASSAATARGLDASQVSYFVSIVSRSPGLSLTAARSAGRAFRNTPRALGSAKAGEPAVRPVYADCVATPCARGGVETVLIDLPELGRGPSRCSRITRRARSRCSGRTTIARGPPVVSPSIAPDPRFVTRCMHGTPASRRMAHTKTASNSEATTSITARSLTTESIAERASRPSSGCPGRDVVSNTSRAGKRARRRHASEITKRGRTKDRTGSHALAARGSPGCDAARLGDVAWASAEASRSPGSSRGRHPTEKCSSSSARW